MFGKIKVIFQHDFDSDLYMLTKEPSAANWQVIVHCSDGRKHTPAIENFSAYPGCETHENKVAWPVDYFLAEKIEIRRPGRKTVILRHPNPQ